MKVFNIDFPSIPYFDYVRGLLNKTWNPDNIISGQAATEDQLKAAIEGVTASIQTDTNTITTATGKDGITVEDTATDGNHAYVIGIGTQITVGLLDDSPGGIEEDEPTSNNPILIDGENGVINGLTNKTWNANSITSGQAATEDQLKAAIEAIEDDDTITTVSAGDNIDVTKSGDDYTVSLIDDYMVTSVNRNIIVTAKGDGTKNVFKYDVNEALKGINHLKNFVSGTDKIEISGTSLPKGALSNWGDGTAEGIGAMAVDGSPVEITYFDTDGTNKGVIVFDDDLTVRVSDITIV